MIAYTDYPFLALGDEPWYPAPIRKVKVVSFDGDKYCQIEIVNTEYSGYDYNNYIKSGYLYKHEKFVGVESIDKKELAKLIRNKASRRAYRKQLFKTRINMKNS
jgi:hypothetical protein